MKVLILHAKYLMYCFLLIFLARNNFVFSQQHTGVKYTVEIKSSNLRTAVEYTNEVTKANIAYDGNLLAKYNVAQQKIEANSVEEILDYLLDGTYLKFIKQNDVYLIQASNKLYSSKSALKHTYRFSGYIEDKYSQERLLNTAIVIHGNNHEGTTTNNYGYFSLIVSRPIVAVSIFHEGYMPIDTNLDLRQYSNTSVWKLDYDTLELDEIKYSIEDNSVVDFSNGKLQFNSNSIRYTPRLLGENDVLRTMQYFPGIQQSRDGQMGNIVRGGNIDQNLTLLDGATIYAPYHVMGLFSSFNTNILKHVDLYKGVFPSRFGGRSSSVLDVTTKDGHLSQYHGSASLGVLLGQFHLEGPLFKNRTSFVLAARRTYWDALMTPLLRYSKSDVTSLKLRFYDINLKLLHKIGDKDRLYFSMLNCDDNYYFVDTSSVSSLSSDWRFHWKNKHYTLRWNHIFNNSSFSNLMLFYTDFLYDAHIKTLNDENNIIAAQNLQSYSGINDYGLKYDWEYASSVNNKVSAGVLLAYKEISPGQILGYENLDKDNLKSYKSIYSSCYFEDAYDINSKLKATLGVHLSMFNTDKWYINPEPRFNVVYNIKEILSLQFGYSRMSQYVHMVNRNDLVLPSEIWISSTRNISPQIADQISFSISNLNLNNGFHFKLEPYYKWMNNVKYFTPNTIIDNNNLDQFGIDLQEGQGLSYGIDIYGRYMYRNLKSYASYTLAKDLRKFDNINNGEYYPSNFDRRHVVKLGVDGKILKNLIFNVAWIYQSATPITVPTSWYEGLDASQPNDVTRKFIPIYTTVNNKRIRDYHRLDIGLSYTIHRKKTNSVWNLSVFNAYNRHNPVLYTSIWEDGKTKMMTTNYLGLIPSLSYTLNF